MGKRTAPRAREAGNKDLAKVERITIEDLKALLKEGYHVTVRQGLFLLMKRETDAGTSFIFLTMDDRPQNAEYPIYNKADLTKTQYDRLIATSFRDALATVPHPKIPR